MSKTDNGGPAFPVTEANGVNGDMGITVRDYFAGLAIPALISQVGGTYASDAEQAYKVADAMLAERGK